MTGSHDCTCPPRERLVQFLLGQLPEPELDSVEQHLSACSSCGDTLQALNAEDTLVALTRSAQAELSEAEMVDGLIAEIRELASTRASGTDVSRGPAQGAGDERAEGIRHRFKPPQQPEEWGRLADYRVLAHLGSGGMGVVFEAEDEKLKRPVALKVLRPSLGPGAQDRFLQEARAAAAIDHENVVTIYQVGADQGLAFLAMQRLDGETLEGLVKREGKLPAEQCLRIGRQIAMGLRAAHAQNLIHRDVKPANIWVEAGRDRVKILDFGLARVLDDAPQLTESGMIAGTPAYMSPEQARGERVNERSDLFSLGCVLYRLATGKLPFQGANALATLRAVEQRDPQPLQELNPQVPQPLAELVTWLLEKDPDRRPQSADAVVEALDEIDQSDWQSISSPSFPTRPKRSTRARVLWRWTVGVAAVLLLGATAYFAAPTIIRIATNQGQLVIKTNDRNVKVEVLQGADVVRIIDLSTEESMDLKAGEYSIQLADAEGGWSLSTRNFTLTRGGRQIVEVRHEQAEIAAEQGDLSRHVSPTSTALTYDGRTLRQWFAELETERKPERLTEAVRALMALGDEESAGEAARAVFRVMRRHGSMNFGNDARGKLIEASRQALWEMPPDAVIPAMIEEIRSGNEKSREFMFWMAVVPGSGMGYETQPVGNLAAELKRRAGEILAAVLAVSRHGSSATRDWALQFAARFCGAQEIDPGEIEGLIPRFQEELPSRDVSKILLVSGMLVKNAPDTEGLVDSLTYVLSDENARYRLSAIQYLGELGPRAAPAVPKLGELLTEYWWPAPITPGTTPPWMVPAYGMGAGSDLRVEIIQALGKIGPAAKAALPVLRKALEGPYLGKDPQVEKAIAQIEGTPQGDAP